jgi:hypothetical protein
VDPKTQHNSTEFAEDEGEEEKPEEQGTPEVPDDETNDLS